MKMAHLQPFNSTVSKPYPVEKKNHGTESLKDFLQEIRFLFSYLDFKWLPFPNRLSQVVGASYD
jgi:hypothetical protein